MFLAIPERAWPALLDEAIRVTRTGGWIESIESWTTESQALPGFYTFTAWVNELLWRRGLDPLIAHKMPEMMRARGLEWVATHEFPHIHPQSRRWKQVYTTLGLSMMENLRVSIITHGIATPEQYDLLVTRARQEMQNGRWPTWPAYVTYGQVRNAFPRK